ncbi:uncharacterized protein LOC142341262 [Convolutriloba macropyga]|uniref:uncharacterized protein LOC142341262 n=1 Tax=Convolutriloba macropyga TaxID=536237 RepID=UPI003F5284FD
MDIPSQTKHFYVQTIRDRSLSSGFFTLSNKIVLSELVLLKYEGVVGETFCGSQCVLHEACKAYNYNLAVKQCQLLATDMQLMNESLPGAVPAGVWVHRSMGPLPRGCPTDYSSVLTDCLDLWVESVTTHQMVIVWREPSDDDIKSQFLMNRQQITISNKLHRGQLTDFPADVIVDSNVNRVIRRHVFTPLTPGAHYAIEIRSYFHQNIEINHPLNTEDSLYPTRPVFGGLRVYEKTLYLNWTLEGSADHFHIWNVPGDDSSCASATNSVCQLDVKTKETYIYDLVAGQEYTVYFKSISYNKESWILEKVQATYTDLLESSSGLYTRTYISTPKQVQLFINTRSGVGSKHEVLLSSRDLRIVPKIYTHTFSLNQYFNFHVCCGYYAMKGGVFYTMNVTAYSRGSTPVKREYFTTAISYPEKPVKDRSWSATTTSIWLSVSIEGIIHGWRLSGVPSCSSYCTLGSWVRSYTISSLSPGTDYTIKLAAFVEYDGVTKVGNELSEYYSTYPEAPSNSDSYESRTGSEFIRQLFNL